MRTIHDLRTAKLTGANAVTIGNFDGMHLGHRALVERTSQHAAASGGYSILLTFDPHPAAVLRPDATILHLMPTWERLRHAARLGAEIGVIQPFTRELANLEARDFVALLKQHLAMSTLVVGSDFALGKGRKGDILTLRALGDDFGFSVEVVESVELQGIPVRSSTIRTALQGGDLDLANALLGRNYSVTGIVALGDKRGRTIGVPTANVQPDLHAVIPANGVYATIARLATPDALYAFVAATNVGTRPTVDGLHRRVEAHLLDFPPADLPDDLYGQQLTVEFVARLRDEQRFESLDALVAQIRADIASTRARLPLP